MKKILCILLTVIMVASLFAVPANARGYTLSVPKTVNAHNLNSYGLKTLNVYETATEPTIDGRIGEGEYPGPNGGMADSVSVAGASNDGYYNHGLWMSSHSAGNQNGYSGNLDFTGYTSPNDVPHAVETYLTYDSSYLYFAIVYRHIPAQFAAKVSGRNASLVFDTRAGFMQSSNPVEAHSSVAMNRFNVTASSALSASNNAGDKGAAVNTAYVYNASASTKFGRQIRQILNGKDTTHYISYYVDPQGTAWGSTAGTSDAYKRVENTCYHIDVLDDSFVDEKGVTRAYWDLTFEGRQPLGDILRISDVEYEDGTPIDYMPEWGTWGTCLRYYSSARVKSTAPNGTEVVLAYDEAIMAQTMLPASGMAYTGVNSRVGKYEFHNTVQSAFASASGTSVTSGFSYLANPVHFLGFYDDGGFDMDAFYGSGTGSAVSIATSTTRATRRKNPALQEFDGSVSRVIGVASRASTNTGDHAGLTIALTVVMVVCAGGAVAAILLGKKRKSNR